MVQRGHVAGFAQMLGNIRWTGNEYRILKTHLTTFVMLLTKGKQCHFRMKHF